MKQQNWTLERIQEGFIKFSNEHGRLPTVSEIDHVSYLPSSRWIQLQFGGLEKVRTLLGYTESHFGKGTFRSVIAHRVNNRGRSAELMLESLLKKLFGEVFVHTEKMFNDTFKNRVDFYIYSPNGNFGVDIFYPDNLKTLSSNVNIKMKKYKNFTEKLYFVVANENISQQELDSYMQAKKNSVSSNIEVLAYKAFLSVITQKKAYPNPLKRS